MINYKQDNIDELLLNRLLDFVDVNQAYKILSVLNSKQAMHQMFYVLTEGYEKYKNRYVCYGREEGAYSGWIEIYETVPYRLRNKCFKVFIDEEDKVL